LGFCRHPVSVKTDNKHVAVASPPRPTALEFLRCSIAILALYD
jgi:hypothetical protein